MDESLPIITTLPPLACSAWPWAGEDWIRSLPPLTLLTPPVLADALRRPLREVLFGPRAGCAGSTFDWVLLEGYPEPCVNLVATLRARLDRSRSAIPIPSIN